MLNGFWGKIWAGGGSFWMNKDCLKEYPSLIYSLLIKNDKKCNDIYMTWGHMVGGPQNTVTPIPLHQNKTSIPNKQTSWPKHWSNRSRRKKATSARLASRRSTLKNFWKAPCASMAQPSTLACFRQVVARRRGWSLAGMFFWVGSWFFGAFVFWGIRFWP